MDGRVFDDSGVRWCGYHSEENLSRQRTVGCVDVSTATKEKKRDEKLSEAWTSHSTNGLVDGTNVLRRICLL